MSCKWYETREDREGFTCNCGIISMPCHWIWSALHCIVLGGTKWKLYAGVNVWLVMHCEIIGRENSFSGRMGSWLAFPRHKRYTSGSRAEDTRGIFVKLIWSAENQTILLVQWCQSTWIGNNVLQFQPTRIANSSINNIINTWSHKCLVHVSGKAIFKNSCFLSSIKYLFLHYTSIVATNSHYCSKRQFCN